jgi:hypothetical protein
MTLVIPRHPMVVTRSCDSTRNNMWVPILPPVEWTAPTTRLTKGPGASVRVLYLGYRGMPVMAQPHKPVRDTPGGFQYLDCRYPDSQHCHKYSSPGLHIPRKRHHHPLQWQDKTAPGRTDSKSLSSQVKLASHTTDSRNLLECHPP